jgi:hypothetical protein
MITFGKPLFRFSIETRDGDNEYLETIFIQAKSIQAAQRHLIANRFPKSDWVKTYGDGLGGVSKYQQKGDYRLSYLSEGSPINSIEDLLSSLGVEQA